MRPEVRAVLSLAACCLLCVACSRRSYRPAVDQVDVFVTAFDPDAFAVQAAVVTASRSVRPALWIVAGDVLAEGAPGDTGYRAAVCRLLRAGLADAVLLSPSWLGTSGNEVRRAIDDAGCYVLGCGVVDSAGSPVGHQFMVKRVGSVRIGLTGAWPEMPSAAAVRSGLELLPADRAVRAAVELLRPRSDAVGVVLGPGGLASSVDVEFVLGADAVTGAVKPGTSDGLYVVGLTFAGNTLTGVTSSVRPAAVLEPDSVVARLVRELLSLRRQVGRAERSALRCGIERVQ